MNSTANRLRRWSRNVHRELSFFFSGMLLIYAVSGLVMNHRDTINPNYSVEQRRYVVGEPLPARDRLTRDDVVRLLAPLDEADNYTKHYFPESDVLKVFLKGGSSLTVRRGVLREADAPSRAGGHDAPALQSRAVVDVVLGSVRRGTRGDRRKRLVAAQRAERASGARRRGTGRRYRRSIVVPDFLLNVFDKSRAQSRTRSGYTGAGKRRMRFNV